MDDEEQFYHQIRLIQRRTKCSNHVYDQFVRIFKKLSKEKGRSIKSFDKKAKRAAGTEYLILHGCPKCDKYVYGPNDPNDHCPFRKEGGAVCGHPRFDAHNQPWEVIVVFLFCFFKSLLFKFAFCYCYLQKAFYFPLHSRLRSLLRVPGFRGLLEHEFTRPRPNNANVMADVYDCPEWQSLMGPPQSPCESIGLQGCSDGFQAHNTGSLSMKPIVYAIMSLPPALRYRSEFMMLSMLLPANAKAFGQKKYYDFSSKFEMNALFYTGKSFYCILCIFC